MNKLTPVHDDAEKLYRIRRKLGMTQKQFGAELGITDSTVANYERRRTRVSLDAMQKAEELERKSCSASGNHNALSPNNPIEEEPSTRHSVSVAEPPRSILGRLGRFADQTLANRQMYYSPLRKRIDTMVFSLFMFSSTTFLIEQVQRNAPNASDQGLFQDLLFVGSFVLCTMLVIPVVVSAAWGIGPRSDGKGDAGTIEGKSDKSSTKI